MKASKNGWKAISDVCKTANATPIRVGGRVGVKVEKIRDRVQVFGEGNIIENTFVSKWQNPFKEANCLAVQFRDKNNNWFVEVERAEVRMPDGPIHELGDFTIGLHLHADVNVDISLKVVAEE